MLELTDVTRSFKVGPGQMPILRGISLRVEKGELASIMGGSGSGKTTLMNIIGLLDKPSSGSYAVGGQDVLRAEANELSRLRNRLIGFVFQSFFLLPRMNAWRNVALPLMYRGVPEAEARRRALAMLERVGLAERTDHMPAQLSGGQRQRVAIARALVGEPAVVLADEPTGALDPKVSQEIMELFLEMNRELGVLIIIITHDPGVAAQCPRRIHLDAGRIASDTGPGSGLGGMPIRRVA
ncbi:ABC transporter ATP-binding protein [Roseomonas sp. SSH11]|uniref:ABC transporter ATP-binding protein n=1 Tax=Pararoseomonas baculiformis TaxID=2820812 RepID=A0ABS4AA80_9PROT|nr:ABC transporter ATP-binding protein [Pararoseomonas baculiformis]MBP0443912.1 ABC transporter ATP-binding protein [Pararoseomonas baculiformis]